MLHPVYRSRALPTGVRPARHIRLLVQHTTGKPLLFLVKSKLGFNALAFFIGQGSLGRSVLFYITRICVIGVSNAWKVRFYKPCTSAVPESEFDYINRILRLKVGVIVYKVSRLSRCQGYRLIAYLFYGRFTGRFVVVKQNAQVFALRHARRWERRTPVCLKLILCLPAPIYPFEHAWSFVFASLITGTTRIQTMLRQMPCFQNGLSYLHGSGVT